MQNLASAGKTPNKNANKVYEMGFMFDSSKLRSSRCILPHLRHTT
jgi:hypothetical protein